MIPLVIVAVAGQLADLVTFIAAVSKHGIGGETNPVIGALYQMGGHPLVAIAKIAFLGVVLLSVYAMARSQTPTWVPASILAFAGLAGLLGSATNVWAVTR